MSPLRVPVARAARPALLRRAAGVLVTALLSTLSSCSSDVRDPSGMGDAGGERACPSDLPSDVACATQAPSYEREVAPIIERRCLGCHYRGNTQSGKVLVEYDDVYSMRPTVLTRIYSCVMPPEGAPALTPDERRALLQWFVCGAPQN